MRESDNTDDEEENASEDTTAGEQQRDESGSRGGTRPQLPRVDDPPYPIDPPGESPDGDEYNERYLCEGMQAEPSLPFEQLSEVRTIGGSLDYTEADPAYQVRSIANRTALERAIDIEQSRDGDRLDAVDFDDESVILVESGFGSSSVSQQFERVELTERTLHLHGCYIQPFVRTSDYTSWATAVIVEHDQPFEHAQVSLTVAADRRVNFTTTEGLVTVEE